MRYLALLLASVSAQPLQLFEVSFPGQGFSVNVLAAHPVSPLLSGLLADAAPVLASEFDLPPPLLRLPAGSRLKAVANLSEITALLLALKSLLEASYKTATDLFHKLGGRRELQAFVPVVDATLPSTGDALTILQLQVALGKSVLAVGLVVDKLMEETGLDGAALGGGALFVGGLSTPPPSGTRLQAAGGAFSSTAGTAFADTWLSGTLAAQLAGCSSGGAALALARARVERIKVILEEMKMLDLLALCSAKEVAETCVGTPPHPHRCYDASFPFRLRGA